MNENIDLTKILKDCPKGWKLYSTVLGYIAFEEVNNDNEVYPIVVSFKDGMYDSFTADGKMIMEHEGECTLFPSREQRDWSKFTAPWYKKEKFDKKKVKPKFKVGDRIRHKVTNKDDVYKISKVYDDSYEIDDFNWMIYIKYQDQYELVPNKFDPKILQPFDKVLVIDSDRLWTPLLFSYLEYSLNYPRMQCFDFTARKVIPYNDDTKHLIGTTDEAPEYYRYWED